MNKAQFALGLGILIPVTLATTAIGVALAMKPSGSTVENSPPMVESIVSPTNSPIIINSPSKQPKPKNIIVQSSDEPGLPGGNTGTGGGGGGSGNSGGPATSKPSAPPKPSPITPPSPIINPR